MLRLNRSKIEPEIFQSLAMNMHDKKHPTCFDRDSATASMDFARASALAMMALASPVEAKVVRKKFFRSIHNTSPSALLICSILKASDDRI